MKVAIEIHLFVAVLVFDRTVAFVITRTTKVSTSVQQVQNSYFDSDTNVRLGGGTGVREEKNSRRSGTKTVDDRVLMNEYQSAPMVPFQQQQQQQQQQQVQQQERQTNRGQSRPAAPIPRSAGEYYSRAEEQQQRQQPFSASRSSSARETGPSSYRPQAQWWETSSNPHGMMSTDPVAGVEVQGNARTMFNTSYRHDTGRQQVYLTTEGRPLEADVELYEGPNNTPTRLRVYSEDGQLRPFRTTIASPNARGNGLSVRNVGPLEFPISASVRNNNAYDGDSIGYNQQHGSIMDNNDIWNSSDGSARRGTQPRQTTAMPTTTERKTVQGGSLKTFTIPESVAAVQVVIVTDGMPMYANVELWGCGGHVKQVAQIYNDNGSSRPFTAVVDTPGGGPNTICVRNTGPMAYPIKVSIEPLYHEDNY
jgi:hypothetical protein